jgi:hypothetical protein
VVFDVRAENLEVYHGDLDEHYAKDRMAGLIQVLTYSTNDKRHNRPNPSKIPFDGDIYSNLASYRDAVKRYRKFRGEVSGDGSTSPAPEGNGLAAVAEEEIGQRIGLERDMQAAIRIEIAQLEPGLMIIDDGAERSVESGFIDITARDTSGSTVVIELKAGVAGQRAVAQILSYMGDVAAEHEGEQIRGILVASGFDAKAKAAARMVPNLILRKYSVRFMFSDGQA